MPSSAPPAYHASSNGNLVDPDSASIMSESSTLKSNLYDVGYGFSTPSLQIDGAYLDEKARSTVPHEPSRLRRRSPSPNPKATGRSGRGPSPSSRARSRSPNPSPPTRTQLEALAGSLGRDSVPHSTELDSIPCAGIRIPNGPFSGLLAWRLVVRVHPHTQRHSSPASRSREFALLPKTDIRHSRNMPQRPRTAVVGPSGLCGAPNTDANESPDETVGVFASEMTERKKKRMSLDALSTLGVGLKRPAGSGHARTKSDLAPPAAPFHGGSTTGRGSMDSVASMPPIGLVRHSMDVRRSSSDDDYAASAWGMLPSSSTPALVSPYGNSRASMSSSILSRRSPSPPPPSTVHADAVVTNFLFDTSLGHNTISRETLATLGFNPAIIDGLDASEVPASTSQYLNVTAEMAEETSSASFSQYDSSNPKTVSLYVQDLAKPITFRLAPPGEPSRLGVQFLLESDVNVCIGEGGRGVIMWADKAEKRMTLQNVPRTVPLPKLSLQNKVRALFGL